MPAVIDYPASKRPVDRHGFVVRGWAWLGAEHAQLAAVEAWNGDVLLGACDTFTRRPDVNAAHGLAADVRTGFELIAQHPALARGSEFAVELRARWRSGERSEILCAQPLRALGASRIIAEEPAVQVVPGSAADDFEPPAHLQVRQVAGVWGPKFYASGGEMLAQLAHAFRAVGRPLESAAAVLDFGCGCGRVLRAFKDFPHTGKIFGSDIDAESIAWDRAHLGGMASFEVNRALPPTAFSDGQFDAIYSVSVFTHLPEEMQFAWLTELRRVLRPGGLLAVSLHGARYWTADTGVCAEVAARGFAYREGPRTAGLPEFYMVAYHSEAYLHERWARFFDIVDYRENYLHGVHDLAVLRRRDD